MIDESVTISQVLHPDGAVLGFEIVANDGRMYFVEKPSGSLEGMRCGSFPNTNSGDKINVSFERVEIARLE